MKGFDGGLERQNRGASVFERNVRGSPFRNHAILLLLIRLDVLLRSAGVCSQVKLLQNNAPIFFHVLNYKLISYLNGRNQIPLVNCNR